MQTKNEVLYNALREAQSTVEKTLTEKIGYSFLSRMPKPCTSIDDIINKNHHNKNNKSFDQ